MNKVLLIGNLTRDPEEVETAAGVSVCRFSIAVNRPNRGEGEQQTDFFNCTAWRALGKAIMRYTKKGNKVAVTGSIQMRNYVDNQGIKRTAVDVIVQDVEFLTPKTTKSGGRDSASAGKPGMEPMEDDEDIPF